MRSDILSTTPLLCLRNRVSILVISRYYVTEVCSILSGVSFAYHATTAVLWTVKSFRFSSVLWLVKMYSFIYCAHVVYYAYSYTNICGIIVKYNDDFNERTNERTNTLLYKNITLTLYSRCLCCVWETQVLLLNIAALLPHLGLGCSTGDRWGSQPSICKLVLTLASCPRLPRRRRGHLSIFFPNVHLLPLFFRLFTQVNLLIDGSVEGQYITLRKEKICSFNFVLYCNDFFLLACVIWKVNIGRFDSAIWIVNKFYYLSLICKMFSFNSICWIVKISYLFPLFEL